MTHTLLAIDDVSLPLRKNVCLYLNKPVVRREPVLAPSPLDSNAPDNAATIRFKNSLSGGSLSEGQLDAEGKKLLAELKACFMMPESEYLAWVRGCLTDEVRVRLDVTPGRDVVNVLGSFFSWDSCTALLTAMRGLCHKKTATRVVYNCGMGPDSGHFTLNDRFRRPPFNMIAPEEVWQWFEDREAPVGSLPEGGSDG